MDEVLPDFSDKSVAFYLTASPDAPRWLSEGIVLESPYFQKQSDRVFVVGRTTGWDDGDIWCNNREAAIAWDSVMHYVVLPTDEYREYQRVESEEDGQKVSREAKQVLDAMKVVKKPLVSFSFILFGIVIPIALLVAIIVWIIKTLGQ